MTQRRRGGDFLSTPSLWLGELQTHVAVRHSISNLGCLSAAMRNKNVSPYWLRLLFLRKRVVALCQFTRALGFPAAFNLLPLRETRRKSHLHNNAHHVKLLQWVVMWQVLLKTACNVGNVITGERSKACWRAAVHLLLFARSCCCCYCTHIYAYICICISIYIDFENVFCCCCIYVYDLMIAIITCNSNLVPLLEGLCNSTPCRFQFVYMYTYTYVLLKNSTCCCSCFCCCCVRRLCCCCCCTACSRTCVCVCVYMHLYVCVCMCVCICVCVARSGNLLKQQEQQHVMRWRPGSCMPHRTPICKRTVNSSAGDWAASRTRWGQSSRWRSARWCRPRWCLSCSRTAWNTRAPRCSCSKPVGRARTWSP